MNDRPIRELADVSENRLTWPPPPHRPRTARRIVSQFKKPQIDREEANIRDEMKRWGISRWLISRNHHRLYAGDPAIAIWWEHPKDRSLRVLACDQFETMGENARSIYLTLDRLRAIERYGAYTAEQTIEGARLALPPPEPAGERWWDVLAPDGAEPSDVRRWPLLAIEAVYKTKVEKAHPDRGGSAEAMSRLTNAIAEARRELGT